ncbi:hypothetical protein M2138_000245 [Dysgonomonadaceae bacterium PH5-43]|nr:hypothetical protein [Dysgonomonadaceae bacterium PH5-43]
MLKKCYLFILLGLLLVSCSDDDYNPTPTYDYLDKVEESGSMTTGLIKLALKTFGYKEYMNIVNSDVNCYKVSYYTEYPKGTKIKASGALIISKSFNPEFPTIVYNHGTVTEKEAPSISVSSISNYNIELFLGIALASAYNCAVLLPDYIGYGESNNIIHPYIHKESLGQAGLDMVRAFEEYADNTKGLTFNNDLFITGYSEGGNASLALHEKIENTNNSGLYIYKTVAGSGSYDNVSFAKEFLAQDITLDAHFISSYLWTFNMYKTNYNYSKAYDKVFSESDNALLKANNYDLAYFHTEELDINTNPKLLFNEDFRQGVIDGSDTELINILNKNSFFSFAPKDSVVLIYGTADDWVFPSNSINTYNSIKELGGKARVVEVEGKNHETLLIDYLDLILKELKSAL